MLHRSPVTVFAGLTAAALAMTACTGGGTPATGPPIGLAPAAFRLVSYDSCADALGQLKRAAADYVTAYGIGGGAVPATAGMEAGGSAADARSAAPAPQQLEPFSGTNTHEAGVDEPDVVKTDGRRIVTLMDGTLRVVDAATKRVTGELVLTDANQGRWYADQLLLDGDRALAIGTTSVPMERGPAAADGNASGGMASDAIIAPMTQGTRLTLIDLAGAPRILGSLELEGAFVDARAVGSLARLVIRSGPHLRWVYPSQDRSESAALRANKRILAQSTIDEWLPRYSLDGSAPRPLVGCGDVSHPRQYSGLSMLTVLALDLAGPLQAQDSVAVLADGQTVYGTRASLYIADDHRFGFWPMPMRLAGDSRGPGGRAQPQTEIHKFDVSQPGKPRYVASGAVDGWLLNQYSLSEYAGRLRVATTEEQLSGVEPGPAGEPQTSEPMPDAAITSSAVSVLVQRDDRLLPVGRVDGLGQGERIYSVRFIGPVGYVVTFRQTDPLYTLDLSDPSRPRVVGELKITGFSSYLHPAGDGRLIGVGQDADLDGRVQGTQVSLFDVGNPAAARRLDAYALPGGNSEAEYDPHAFLYWPAEHLLVVPMLAQPAVDGSLQPTDKPMFSGALALRLDGDRLTKLGFISHPSAGMTAYQRDPSIRRSLVIGDTLWTISSAGAMATDIHALADQEWVPFA
jgi:beta propeller domain-containing protein